jgi:predicted CxxxxCH...CXXCH cytochrome family protein
MSCLVDGNDAPSTDPPPPNREPQAGCAAACHGNDVSNAPPKSLSGVTETTAVGVGAHATHLSKASTWHAPILCSDCHVVPADVNSPGHMDGDGKAEVKFSIRAATTWNGTTCASECHGSAAVGGSAPNPKWTQVDGTQVTCGSCHGKPPPSPHPDDQDCAKCHPTMENGNTSFRDPLSHVNGVVDVDNSIGAGCSSCHGSATSSAPPKDLAGNTANTSPRVGAHAKHQGPSDWHREIACSSCHLVPITDAEMRHRDGDNIAEVKFDTLNPAGVYTRTTLTCSNNYCHSNGRGNTGTVVWNVPGAKECTSCHATSGTGMSGRHRLHIQGENMTCNECHGAVVNGQQKIIDAKLHINGVHEIKMANGTFDATARTCANTGCHGTKRW